MSHKITVVAEYETHAAEGINVVSRTLIDDLRAAGHEVDICAPDHILRALPKMIWRPAGTTVFTHGPGPRTVLASLLLRMASATRLVWVATRPDLARTPGWLRGRKSAHYVVCNQQRPDLADVARDAQTIVQPIGIAPERLAASAASVPADPFWAELRARGVPVALHVGHLRATRGLEQLMAVKALLGDRIEVVMLASPRFEPESGLMEALDAAGVRVHRAFVADISEAYRACDLYLFPAPPEQEGAIELPLSVLEAMACKRPVVSTRFGVLEAVLAGEPGVDFADAESFADTVAHRLEAGLLPVPEGLPDAVNAHRLAEVVARIHTEVSCND